MAAPKLKVTYADGRVVTVLATPRAMVMAEEKFGGANNPAAQLQTSYYVAWASLHKAGKEPNDYDTWLDAIAWVEDIEAEDAELDPTSGEEPKPATSSGSASEPE